jgi:Cu(I)/Ag(I) efflux system membrane fusion protein
VQAEAGLATAQSGRGRELVAQSEITTAIAALTQAQEGLLTANANLAQIPITRQETRVAKQTVNQAQAALVQANANRSQIPVAHADVLAAAASVQTAQAAQQQAQVNLDYARIYSPVNGVVNAKTTDVGETAAPGTSLLTLVSLDRVYFEAQVSENNVRDVHVGQTAQITVPAVSAQAFAGYVSDVIPTADPKSRQFRVRVTIPNAPHQLTPGAFARGVLTTQQVRNALTVPTDAIHDEDGTSVLLLATGSGKEARVKRLVVRVGAEAEGKVQIMGGVQVGDQVIMTTQSLHDGDRIRIVQSD